MFLNITKFHNNHYQQFRFSCPPGYVCPYTGMPYPYKCNAKTANETCYSNGLSGPTACPNGTICTTNYRNPIPSPPGFFVMQLSLGNSSIETLGMIECKEGDYCNLARSVVVTAHNESALNDLLCPEGTNCINTTILQPSYCNYTSSFMDHCPAGTVRKA